MTAKRQLLTGLLAGALVWFLGYIIVPPTTGRTALGYQALPEGMNVPANADGQPVADNGRRIYADACLSCHQPLGQGLSTVFPPLRGTDWVTGSPERLILAVLHGITGPIQVNGTTFNSFMPGFGQQLDDEELVAVLNYIRNSWGNQGSPLDTSLVANVRQRSATRQSPWRSQQELESFLGDLFPETVEPAAP
ncbi:MAG: cytochrome c [Corticimicrobacter sp.]|uniref:c-type cytochrome n=1 Tax=Corticimicrobacter sp. TaxID=2678536 RepID=UPI0032DAC193